jgi:hypothetical protein
MMLLFISGLQLTNMSNHKVTPVILMNLNLPPQERYKVDDVLAGMPIPGPITFLRPLVDGFINCRSSLMPPVTAMKTWEAHGFLLWKPIPVS